jgi:hypothetical protein
MEADIPEEITFAQFVEKHVQQVTGRISSQDRFRVGETLPETIPPGYLIKVEAKAIPSMAEALGLRQPEPESEETDEQWEDFLTDSTPNLETQPDAQPRTEPSTQRQEELREEARQVQQRVDNPPQDFIPDSTPDLSRRETQTSESSTSEGESQDSVEGTQLPTTRVRYRQRVELLAHNPHWSDEERHGRFRTMMGVPTEVKTKLVWRDRCAQSDTEPDWTLKEVEEQDPEEWPGTTKMTFLYKSWGHSTTTQNRATREEVERKAHEVFPGIKHTRVVIE